MKKLLTIFFFLSELSLFLELCPFEKNKNEILTARYLEKYLAQELKLGQLIEDAEWITGLTCEQIPSIFSEL